MSEQGELLIIAHRGASADHPENTVEAFVGAREQGADWVELDVRQAADGVTDRSPRSVVSGRPNDLGHRG